MADDVLAPSSSDTLITLDDGSIYDVETGQVYPADNANPFSAAAGLGSQGTGIATIPQNSSNQNADNLSQIINSALSSGVAITSVLTGRPVAVTPQGRVIGAPGSRIAVPQTQWSGGMVLFVGALALGAGWLLFGGK